jgi:hypothetical protein
MTQRARKRDFRDGSISEFFNSIGGERPFIDNALKVRSHARIGRPAAHGGRLRPNRGRSPSRIPPCAGPSRTRSFISTKRGSPPGIPGVPSMRDAGLAPARPHARGSGGAAEGSELRVCVWRRIADVSHKDLSFAPDPTVAISCEMSETTRRGTRRGIR